MAERQLLILEGSTTGMVFLYLERIQVSFEPQHGDEEILET